MSDIVKARCRTPTNKYGDINLTVEKTTLTLGLMDIDYTSQNLYVIIVVSISVFPMLIFTPHKLIHICVYSRRCSLPAVYGECDICN